MSKPPVKSIVFKTTKPSQAQKQASLVQQQSALEGTFRAGLPNPAGPGAARVAPSGATVGLSSRPPLNPGFGSGVSALTSGGKTQVAPKPKVQIKIHPSGAISVTSHGHTATTPPQPSSTPSNATPAPAPKKMPAKKSAPTRAPAAATTTPALSDSALAANQVAAAFDPVEQNLKNLYTTQTGNTANAIKEATSGLADLYKEYAPAAAASYSTAENSQAAVGAALAKALVGQSDAAQAGLAAQLAKIGNPDSANTFNTQAASNAQGAEGVQAAGNSAALTGLIGRGAAAADYGAKLPGLAGLYGLQATRSATNKLNDSYTTAIQDLESKRPQAVQTALSNIASNRYKQQQIDLENKAFGLKVNADKRAQQSLDNQTAKTLSDLYGVDSAGNLTLAGRRVAALEAKAQATLNGKGKSKPLTAAQVNTLTSKAAKDAETFYYGEAPKMYQGQPVAGTGTPPILYNEAVQRLMAKYPGLTIARATKILNSYYKPGEGGRPQFTKKQEQANAIAFPNPFATLPGVTG